MRTKTVDNNKRVIKASFLSFFNQAIVLNFLPLVVVAFMDMYDFTLTKFGVMIGVTFAVQMLTDIVLTAYMHKINYKKLAQWSNILSIVGSLIFVLSPFMTSEPYYVMLVATVFTSMSAGILEVIVSPIVDSIPDSFKSKQTMMSLSHGFYAWGQLTTILVVTLFIYFVGAKYWQIVYSLTLLPYFASIIAYSRADISVTRQQLSIKEDKKIVKSPIFVCIGLAIFFGAGVELIMNQYISAFAQLSLGMNEMFGNMIAMGCFALLMGIGRTVYGVWGNKFDIGWVVIVSSFVSGCLYIVAGLVDVPIVAFVCAVLVGLFSCLCWPGALTVAGKCFANSGAWIFSFLAIMGDLGGMVFPSTAGVVSDKVGISTMLLIMSCCGFLVALTQLLAKILFNRSNKLSIE